LKDNRKPPEDDKNPSQVDSLIQQNPLPQEMKQKTTRNPDKEEIVSLNLG
jgi:hypothetical protein